MAADKKKKIISYLLYGNIERYTKPLIDNSYIYRRLFPSWEMRVYHDKSVDSHVIEQLKKNEVHTIDIETTYNNGHPPKIWRLLPVMDKDSYCTIFRDADSLLTEREREYVEKWINSDMDVHIIRDHPLHIAPILAGMFGVKIGVYDILANLIKEKKYTLDKKHYSYDQIFLADYFYPKICQNALIHTAYFKFSNEKVERTSPCCSEHNFIGAIESERGQTQNNKNKKLMRINGDFTNGISYHTAKRLRYKVRPVIYLSHAVKILQRILSIGMSEGTQK
jgi:hypothetical protein